MSTSRDIILGKIRQGLRGGARLSAEKVAPLEARLANHPVGLVPRRGQDRDRADIVTRFEAEAKAIFTDIARVKSMAEVPAAVADYLSRHNLPAEIAAAPDKLVDQAPWKERPLLQLRRGKPTPTDQVGLSAAFAGVAETGTLMLLSGPDNPSTLNFLPDTHIVLLPAARMVGNLEAAWQRLRDARGSALLPRTVNLVTGPSRTGDIEQKLEMGAHGPRRQLIVIVEDESVT